MINVIEKILLGLEYHLQYCAVSQNVGNGFLVYARGQDDGKIFSCFVLKDIGNCDAESFLNNDQIEIYEGLKDFFAQNESFEKNAILILLRNDERGEVEVNSFVSQIEEDPFYFKKQVISYSGAEKIALEDAIGGFETIKNAASIIYNKERFKNFSTGNSDPLYSILIRLYTKIPSLTLDGDGKEYPILDEIISECLQDNGLTSICKEVLSLDGEEEKIEKWINDILEEGNV